MATEEEEEEEEEEEIQDGTYKASQIKDRIVEFPSHLSLSFYYLARYVSS